MKGVLKMLRMLRVDILSCHGCGRAIVIEEDETVEICPYIVCASEDFDYSHSGQV